MFFGLIQTMTFKVAFNAIIFKHTLNKTSKISPSFYKLIKLIPKNQLNWFTWTQNENQNNIQ